MSKKPSGPQSETVERPGNANLKPWKPGQSGNPGGKPVGARNALTRAFLDALAEDFQNHGKAVLERVRRDEPAAYLRIVAGLVPKEITIDRPLDGLTDEELAAAIDVARERLELVKKQTRH